MKKLNNEQQNSFYIRGENPTESTPTSTQ